MPTARGVPNAPGRPPPPRELGPRSGGRAVPRDPLGTEREREREGGRERERGGNLAEESRR